MDNSTAEKLANILERVSALPPESQELITAEFEERLSELDASSLSPAQRDEVARRLTRPRVHVPEDAIRAILKRFNTSL